MRSLLRSSLFSAAVFSATFAIAQTQPPPGAAGRWEGSISMPEGEVAITVDLATDARGQWIGGVTIPGTTAADVPLDSFAIKGSSVAFHAGLLESPTFSGRLSDDGASLAGDVANARGAVPFRLKRTGEARVNVPPPSTPFAQAKELEGAWEGVAQVGERTVRLALKIAAGADGATVATLVNQGLGVTVPVTTVTFRNKELRLESRAVTGTFMGKLGSDGAIVGEWTQGTQKLALTFKKVSAS